MTFVSILRGINVGGHRKILMQDLKLLYEDLGFVHVKTFIQSGNVIFQTQNSISEDIFSDRIENAIKTSFHFEVPVIIRTADKLQRILSSNPFLLEENIDTDKLHLTLLKNIPKPGIPGNTNNSDFLPDRFAINERDIYLYCPGGYGNTRLSNALFEKMFRSVATTRNWRTIISLSNLVTLE